MKKIITILALVSALAINVIATTVTVNVTVPGSLSYELKKICDWREVDSLKVTGSINSVDIYDIRVMANGFTITDKYNQKVRVPMSEESGRLVYLDLGEANYNAKYGPYLSYTYLEEVILPNSLDDWLLTDKYFEYCDSLKKVKLPPSIKRIERAAFSGLKKLERINLENVEEFGIDAFYNCSNLIVESFSENLKSIENWAFYKCTLPSEVTFTDVSLSDRALSYTKGKHITLVYTKNYDGNQETYSVFAHAGFETAVIKEDTYMARTVGKSIFEHQAFYGCPNLKSISTDVVSPYMVQNCKNLETFSFNNYATFYYTNAEKTASSDVWVNDWFTGCSKVGFYGPEINQQIKGYMTYDGGVYRNLKSKDGSFELSLQLLPRNTETCSVAESCKMVKLLDDGAEGSSKIKNLYLANAEVYDVAYNFNKYFSSETDLTFGENSPYRRDGGFIYSRDLKTGQDQYILRCYESTDLGPTHCVNLPCYQGAYRGEHPELQKLIIGEDVTNADYLFPYATNLRVIRFKSTTPPKVKYTGSTLNEMLKHKDDDDCYIEVPKGYEIYYYANSFWRNFNIREYDTVEEISEDDVTIGVDNGIICLKGVAEGCRIDVFDMAGNNCYSGYDHNIEMSTPGIYIVRVCGVAKKVVVR